ncbi:hypothetical protein ACFX13_042861 [Malus domestica]|uniref:Uncharacterized protein n=1 Tax=Malus domestica TaxID=3750 RepID=A0A498JI28_MALDO|nr:uncharacterized protein LOC103410319 [Malus domestica]RXH95220.1 hypothetical protein DVH24_024904 [Malus domestica]
MALSQSSPILPQNPASFVGRRQRDGCIKGTRRYRAGLSSGYGHVAQSWIRVFHFLRGTAMWRRAGLSSGLNLRKLSTAVRRCIEDEGDWSYASEWRGEESEGHTVLRSTSDKGNGVVSVVAYPSSKPSELHWASTERWLQQRYEEIQECRQDSERFRVLGYQWRALSFNDDTRQSTVKVLAAYRRSEPESIALMQQPHCLALPYLKSMIAAGLATIASCNYNLMNAVTGTGNIRILCIGHGGGSLPLFLASKLQGAIVDVVEIDPLVISASVRAMGFPAFSIMTPSGKRAVTPNTMDTVMWKGIHERLFLHESDAEDFVLNTTIQYDMVFVDAYDGEDIFPRKLWDPHSPFLKALSSRLHPDHGTVVVNLHSDSDILNPDGSAPSVLQPTLPMGKYVSRVCLQAYKDVVVGGKDSGLGFTVSVPWLCNSSLVVCRGFVVTGEDCNRDVIMETLISKSFELENVLNLPFSCFEYIKRGFILVD